MLVYFLRYLNDVTMPETEHVAERFAQVLRALTRNNDKVYTKQQSGLFGKCNLSAISDNVWDASRFNLPWKQLCQTFPRENQGNFMKEIVQINL